MIAFAKVGKNNDTITVAGNEIRRLTKNGANDTISANDVTLLSTNKSTLQDNSKAFANAVLIPPPIIRPKESLRDAWKFGTSILLRKIKNYPTAAWMLEHSLQDNPSDEWRGNDSRIAGLMKKDKKLNEAVDKIIKNLKNDEPIYEKEKYSIVFTQKSDDEFIAEGSVNFSDGELFYSTHLAKVILFGEKQKDGTWKIHCKVTDTYDFTQFLSFMGSNNSFKWKINLGSAANDAATISQMLEIINPYTMTVEFDITR